MKRLLIPYLCLFALVTGNAQTPLDSSRWLYLPFFEYSLPGDILIDISPRMGHAQFAAHINQDSIHHRGNFSSSLHLLKQCARNPSSLPDVHDLNETASAYRDAGYTPIAFMDYTYSYFKDSFYLWSGLQYDSASHQLKSNDSLKHFLDQKAMIRAAVLSSSHFGITQFILPQDLIYGNRSIGTFQIDFGTGSGYQNVQGGDSITINYSSLDTGQSTAAIPIKIRYRDEDDEEIEIKTHVKLLRDHRPDFTRLVSHLNISNSCSDYSESAMNEARISIRYGKDQATAKTLKHPVILIEGFDHDLNPNDQRFGDVTFATLRSGLSIRESDGKYTRTNLKDIPIFVDRLYNANYDLIFIDFKDGSADLFKNGNAVMKVIQWVNEQKIGNDELVIIGASMGGILARYALTKMEELGCIHCAKLYCSFDSPHQGAHVPYSLQMVMKELISRGLVEPSILSTLQTVAAKQMLVSNIVDGSSSYRSEWQNWLDTHGQPQLCSRIAVTNGSPTGEHAFDPRDQIYRRCYTKLGQDLFNLVLYAGKPNARAAALLLPKGRTAVGAWLSAFFGFSYTEFLAFPGNKIYLDHASGGQAPLINELHLKVEELLKEYKGNECYRSINHYHGYNTFVPTYSSLDLSTPYLNPNLQVLLPSSGINSSLTPFHQVFYPTKNLNKGNQNQEHVYIDVSQGQAVDWIMERIDELKNPLGSSLPLDAQRTTYNYNRPGNFEHVLFDLQINNGGVLQLNGTSRLNYQQTTDPYPNIQGDLQNFRTSQCETHIQVKQGGVLEIGDELLGAGSNNRATLRILKGCILDLDGGTLIIHDGSTLIIEEGAQLRYGTDAQIQLRGTQANLIVKGKIVVGASTPFGLTNSTSWSIGSLILEVNPSNSGVLFEAEGPGSAIAITGIQAALFPQIVIRGGNLLLNEDLAYCQLKSTEIQIGEGSALFVHCPVELRDSRISGAGPNKSCIGLKTFGQTGQVISNNSFQQLMEGVDLESSALGSHPIIAHCSFQNCGTGIGVFQGQIQVDQCLFKDCQNGFTYHGASTVSLNESRFEKNQYACFLSGSSLAEADINRCSFEENELGVWVIDGMKVFAQCALFTWNQTAIRSFESSIVLSPSLPVQSNAGNNTFEFNEQCVFGTGALYLEQGMNNFIKDPSSATPFIDFNLPSGCLCLQGHEVPAANNYWSPTPINGISSAGPTYYNIQANTFPHAVQVVLAGQSLPSQNLYCNNGQQEEKENHQQDDEAYASVHENTNNSMRYFPNPANQWLTLEYPEGRAPDKWFVVDLQGRALQTDAQKPDSQSIRISTTHLSDGTYYLKLIRADRVLIYPFVVLHP